MASVPDDLDNITLFQKWFENHGGQFHPHTKFSPVPSGYSVIAAVALPPDTTVVTCPFSLVITPDVALRALTILGLISLESWSERQLVCSYICMHWVIDESRLTSALAHSPYLRTLPAPKKLRTPLHFTPSELEAFKGTNLYGATLDRYRAWQSEWGQCQAAVTAINSEWGLEFTWDRYLTASTYLSSRAFPSTILSSTPSLEYSPSSHPILLPGVDSLNHARGQPVSWLVSHPQDDPARQSQNLKESNISLILHNPTAPGQELFNNYGAKPNSELILGYGFSIPQNPDDTIVLKIGGTEGKKWEVGRAARGVDGVWEEILSLVSESPELEWTYEDSLEAAEVLVDMVQSLMDRLPPTIGAPDHGEMRPEVASMLHDYVEGQRDILESIIEFSLEKEHLAIETAREQGIELVFEDA